jgi:hypothetical protein
MTVEATTLPLRISQPLHPICMVEMGVDTPALACSSFTMQHMQGMQTGLVHGQRQSPKYPLHVLHDLL